VPPSCYRTTGWARAPSNAMATTHCDGHFPLKTLAQAKTVQGMGVAHHLKPTSRPLLSPSKVKKKRFPKGALVQSNHTTSPFVSTLRHTSRRAPNEIPSPSSPSLHEELTRARTPQPRRRLSFFFAFAEFLTARFLFIQQGASSSSPPLLPPHLHTPHSACRAI
jgi:hypothetical protein